MKNLSRALAIVLIIAATFLVYWPALRNGFVWDDTALVLRDPLIRSWRLIPEGFQHFLFLDATASNFYRPIQRLSFVFDYAVFGFEQPGGWHFTSILIHAGAAVALFFLAEKLAALLGSARVEAGTARYYALGASLLWALHPLHTSAVTYVSGRADPLAALFGFTGLTLGLVSLEVGSRAWWWRLASSVCFALALLSKESGLVFMLIWLLVLLWRRANHRAWTTWALLLAVIVGGYCALRFTAQKTPPPSPPPTPLAVRPILAARAFAEYSALFVVPIKLRMERDVSTTPRDTFQATMENARAREFQTLAGVLLFIGFLLWARYCWRRAPEAAFCLGAFAIAYFPISNAFPLNATVAEHWLYVPSAFLFLACFSWLATLKPKGKKKWLSPWRLLIAVIPLGFNYGLRTFARQSDWRDQRTFIERTIGAGGESPRMLMNLGNVELAAGQPERALALYREAVKRAPDQPIIALGQASVMARMRDFSGARQALERAETSPLLRAECLQLRAALDHLETGRNTGNLLLQAAEAAPANWGSRKRYIEYLIERGDLGPASTQLGAFLERYPFRAESWALLGQMQDRAGDKHRAAIAYREAALRDVRDEKTRARLQTLGEETGKR